MAKASTTELFSCSAEQLYKIITEYSKYPEFLSEVKKCTVLKTEGNRKLVEYQVSVIKNFTYEIWTTENPKLVSWEFSSGDIFKTMKGSWKLEEEVKAKAESVHKCRGTYTIEATFGVFVPGPLANALVSVNLPNMISAYHKRIKQIYGI